MATSFSGERMLEAGCVQLWDKNLANVMGFSEVLKKLPALLRLQKKSPEVSAALMAIFIKVLFAWKDNLWLFVKGTINHHYITNYLY
jgi:hypothetical protein